MTGEDIGPYEGLIHATAARYEPILDEDFEDIQQILRLKIWQALQAFDPAKAKQPVKGYVFMCMRNRVKDLLKQQSRRNELRGGSALHIEDVSAGWEDRFETKYLAEDPELVYLSVEDDDLMLPSTLTELERQVVHLLLLDLNQAEMVRALSVKAAVIRAARESVQEKMADWHPSASEATPVATLPRRFDQPDAAKLNLAA